MGPKPAVVVVAVLAGLVVATGLLSIRVGETNDLLRQIVGAQQAGRESAVSSYTVGGVTMSAEIHASPIDVVAPDGTAFEGVSELDMMGRTLIVSSGAGRLIRTIDDPHTYLASEAPFEVPYEMLLELHGWPRERWPEGWSP